MEYKLGNLRIFPYKDIQELENFYCGIAEMDISKDTQTTTRMFRMLYPKQNTEDTEEIEEGLSHD